MVMCCSVGGDVVGARVLALEGRVGAAEHPAGDAACAVGDAAAVPADDVVGHVLVGWRREAEVMEVVVGAEVVQVALGMSMPAWVMRARL